LLRAGSTKKVVTLSTGIADLGFILKSEMALAGAYSISKAATNMVVAKYAVQFKSEGFVFLALSPGLVNTAEKPPTPEELAAYHAMVAQLRKVTPSFEGAITPEESVRKQLEVIGNATVKDTGAFISYHGNKE